MNNDQKNTNKSVEFYKNTLPSLTAKEKNEICKLLVAIMPMQKTYGKEPADLELIIEGWAIALYGYSVKQITDAAWKYVKMRPDVPSPSNIINIIEHGHPDGKQEVRGIKMPTQKEI